MADFLLHLAALSLGGGAVALILMAAGLLTRTRYAAKWRCIGWLLLCLRLAIPLPLLPQQEQPTAPIQLSAPSLEREWPLYLQTTPSENQTQGQTSSPAPGNTGGTSSDQNQSQLPPVTTPAPEAKQPTLSMDQVLLTLWLVGCAGVLVWNAAAHLRLRRYLRRWSEPVPRGEVLHLYHDLGRRLGLNRLPKLRTCPGLTVPMLAGLLHPTLLLPQESLPDKQLEYALLHELTHCQRRDIWLKALALWVRALHWFNPVMWLMARSLERDTELACDEAALKRLPREEHAAYGETILQAVERLQAAQR